MFEKGKKHPLYIDGNCDINKNRFYRKYRAILQRCNNPNSALYSHYGGRGIKNLWESYEDFKNDMYESYLEHKKKHPNDTSLDRIDNDGHYCKENCQWTTQKEQTRNTRRNYRVYYNGNYYTIFQLKKMFPYDKSLSNRTIKVRLQDGWRVKDALIKPSGYIKPFSLDNADISSCTLREKHFLFKRAEGMTYDAIGEEEGLTRERVRQILCRAWRRIGQRLDK